MDALVKRCEHCGEPMPEAKRGRPQRFCSDAHRQAQRKINATPRNGLRYRTSRVKPKEASQDSDSLREFKPENLSLKTKFHFERVNEITFKLIDGEVTNVPASHGKWAGYLWPVVSAMSRRELRTLILQRGKGECSRNGEGFLRRLLHRESNRPPQRVASSPARLRRGSRK